MRNILGFGQIKLSDNLLDTRKKKIFFALILCVPIIIFCMPLLLSGNRIAYGDADYQYQMYAAFRITLLHYHQFPWWNPWMDGGIPLFANAQFGPISITSLMVIIFGVVMGIKIASVVYIIVGFFGFLVLARRYFKQPLLRSVLISYIWAFTSFTTYRIIGGHYTFLLAQYLPWVLYLYLTRIKSKWRWLQLGLLLSLMIWSAPHYTTIMSIIFVFFLVFYEYLLVAVKALLKLKHENLWSKIKYDAIFWLKTGVLALLLSVYRLYYVVKFLKSFPRPASAWPEPYFGIYKGFLTMFGPIQFGPNAPKPPIWSWLEASYSIGTFSLLVLILIGYVVIIKHYKNTKNKEKLFVYSPIVLILVFLTCFILAQGRFSPYAPFTLLQKLPVFSFMRVAMRWFLGCSVVCLLLIASYKAKYFYKTINILLLLSVVQLFITCTSALNGAYTVTAKQIRPTNAPFEQKSFWYAHANDNIVDENLYEATINNVGQIRAGDALVDNRQPNTTSRCSESSTCKFVLSNNAKVTYWSPNKIMLQRVSSGPIIIDMNPGSGWRVNGKYTFLDMRVTEPKLSFVINDKNSVITLSYVPRYSIEWFINKV